MTGTPRRSSYYLFQGAIIIFVVFLLSGSLWLDTRRDTFTAVPPPAPEPEKVVVATTTPPPPPEVASVKPPPAVTFSNLTLRAKAAIVYNPLTHQIIFAKNARATLPIASITKLMTAYAAEMILPAESIVSITPDEASTTNSAGLRAGESWHLGDLVPFMLVSSSNGAALAIARTVEEQTGQIFVTEMNRLARELGLNETLFRNPTGLDLETDGISGSYGSAYDIARLYSYILADKPDALDGTASAYLAKYSLDNFRHEAANTNPLVGKISGLRSSKTGTTDLAGGNLAVIYEPLRGRPVVIVILGSTAAGRYTDLDQLTKATINFWKKP